ncbi:GNAT family N-acetyltransferase [Humidisolicoccus flavus]|uniref:GNAT family N-acetyltransferase n=1 Tax=Humidisolicoccus flavus TaxID=3111414 RepID=UPI0032552113
MVARTPTLTSITGRSVRVEPLTLDHAAELRAAIAVPEVFAGGYGGGPAGLDQSPEGWQRFMQRLYPFAAGLPLAVRGVGGADDGVLIGTTSFGGIDLARESLHLGWTAYAPRVWGTSVNPETKLLMLQLAFDHGFGRVKIQADARNARSRAAIAKLGATFEGIARREQQRADGTWRDTAIFSILREEWPAIEAQLKSRVDALLAPKN